jgi:hydrogenase expression/formation protein HypC
MCLAIPMKIVRIQEDGKAVVRQDNLETQTDISLLQDAKVGDYVIIHAGYAIERLDLEDAQERLELFRAVAEVAEAAELSEAAELDEADG